jgi:DNA invertase Pin-like site-specific DNA recombinase
MSEPVSQPDATAAAARQAILAAAEGHGWREVDRAWIDNSGLSASDLQRPGIEGALDALRRRRARALVVAKLDRIDPSIRDVARLMDTVTRQTWALVALEVRLQTAHGNAALATFVPYERRFLAERTRAALAARKAAGLHVGRERAVPEDVVQRIVTERQSGASLRSIARGLNADGIRGSARGNWHASTVRYVLMSVEHDATLRATRDVATPPQPTARPPAIA